MIHLSMTITRLEIVWAILLGGTGLGVWVTARICRTERHEARRRTKARTYDKRTTFGGQR